VEPLLLLFDIDGTLVGGATDEHRDALHAALMEVHRVDARKVGPTLSRAGRTDGEIARALLLDAGVSAERIDDRADAVREACCRAYVDLCPADLSDKVLPGIRDLLPWCGDHEQIRLSLLTGNYEPIARLKLARAGIGKHFPSGQGAFGSDAEDRAALPAIARRRAGPLGIPHQRERTIVIGDTPRDIACAQADGARCFAVATGPFKVTQLISADHALADATGLRAVLDEELTA
jgi:phosphoglycolate phosphatase